MSRPGDAQSGTVSLPPRFPTDVRVRWSTSADGDFHLDQEPSVLEATRRAFVDLPWSQPDEVHGRDVDVVASPGDRDRTRADALVTEVPGAVLGIWVGDCAPVALVSASGRIGAVHAGWRGTLSGVLQNAVEALRRTPDDSVVALVGPCIRPCCYEFGPVELALMIERYGEGVASSTTCGTPALDMTAAIAAALDEVSVPLDDRGECTACTPGRYWSHRARGDRRRQVMAVWKHPAGDRS